MHLCQCSIRLADWISAFQTFVWLTIAEYTFCLLLYIMVVLKCLDKDPQHDIHTQCFLSVFPTLTIHIIGLDSFLCSILHINSLLEILKTKYSLIFMIDHSLILNKVTQTIPRISHIQVAGERRKLPFSASIFYNNITAFVIHVLCHCFVLVILSRFGFNLVT